MWEGESSKLVRRRKYKLLSSSGVKHPFLLSWSVSPNRSYSINDSNIFNCNRRFKVDSNEGLEVELWSITSDLWIVCSRDKEVIIQIFRDMEQRDAKLLSTQRCEGRIETL